MNRKITALAAVAAVSVSVLASCAPVPEAVNLEKPEPVAESIETVSMPAEDDTDMCTALYNGIYASSGMLSRGDEITVSGEVGEYYVFDNGQMSVYIHKKDVKPSGDMPVAYPAVLTDTAILYATAFYGGDPVELPAGTVVNVEDENCGMLFVRYSDAEGNELTGYLPESSPISTEIESSEPEETEETKSTKKKSSSKSSSTGSSSSKGSSSSEGGGTVPAPDPEPAPSETDQNDGDDVDLDVMSARYSMFSDTLGIMPVAVTDDFVEEPMGLEGDDQSDNPEGTTAETPQQTMRVFSDNTDIYSGRLTKGEKYEVTGESEDGLVTLVFMNQPANVPEWAVKMAGDSDYEQHMMYAVAELTVNTEAWGRGADTTIAAGTALNVTGETGTELILETEDGETFYLAAEGSDALLTEVAPAAEPEPAEEEQEEPEKKEKKSSKKTSSSSSESSAAQNMQQIVEIQQQVQITPDTVKENPQGDDDGGYTEWVK